MVVCRDEGLCSVSLSKFTSEELDLKKDSNFLVHGDAISPGSCSQAGEQGSRGWLQSYTWVSSLHTDLGCLCISQSMRWSQNSVCGPGDSQTSLRQLVRMKNQCQKDI